MTDPTNITTNPDTALGLDIVNCVRQWYAEHPTVDQQLAITSGVIMFELQHKVEIPTSSFLKISELLYLILDELDDDEPAGQTLFDITEVGLLWRLAAKSTVE